MKLLRIFLILIPSLLLCACSQSKDSEKYIEIDDSQNSLLYASSEYDYEEVLEVLSLKPSIEDLHSSVQLDFVKTTTSGYSTILRTEKGFVLVGFNSLGGYSYAKKISFSQGITEDDMDRISNGLPLTNIQKIDPDGDYSFLFASWSGIPAISHHYLENGIHYIIYYDEKLCALCIEKELI